MRLALNAWTFPETTTLDEQLAHCVAAGFEGLELVVSAEGALTPASDPRACAAFAARAASAGVPIVSLASGLFFQTNFGSADESDRRRARELCVRMLDLAAAMGAGAIVVIPAVVGRAQDPRPACSYADAWNHTLAGLGELAPAGAARGVKFAVENVWNRFLLSPLEAANLLDRINSPWVGWCLDTGNVLAWGYPQDWIRVLGGRLAHVHLKDYDLNRPGREGFCALGAGHVDFAACVAALGEVRYDGPLVYEGRGEPKELARQMRALRRGAGG